MKFSILINDLLDMVSETYSITAKENFRFEGVEYPILLTVENGVLKVLSAADEMCLTLSRDVSKREHENGMVVVSGKLLKENLASIAKEADVVEVFLEAERMVIKWNRNKVRIGYRTWDHFVFGPHDAWKPIETLLLGDDVWNILTPLIALSAAKEDNRPILTGIAVKPAGNVKVWSSELKSDVEVFAPARICASDGYRLSDYILDGYEGEHEFIFPVVAVKYLVKTMLNDDASLALYDGFLVATSPDRKLVIALIDGQYPNIQSIIPKSASKCAEVNRIELLRAVKRTEPFARDANNTINLCFNVKRPNQAINQNPVVTVFGKSNERGECESEIDLLVYRGDFPFEVSVNCQYLMKLLEASSGQTIGIQANEYNSPIVLMLEGLPAFKYIIMPMTKTR